MVYIDCFDECSSKFSDRIAVVDHNGQRKVTYGELAAMAKKAARLISDIKTESGEPFIIRMSRTAEYIAVYLGILYSGCVAVPVTTAYPEERISAIKADCKAKHVIDDSFFDNEPSSSEPVHVRREGTDTALLLYTSGSTGNPKGVVHDHNSVVASTERTFELAEGIEVLNYAAFSPFNFAPSTSDIFGMFRLGGTVFIIEDDVRKDPTKLIDFYCAHDITLTFVPPSLLKIMLRLIEDEELPLKRVLCGAERMVNIFTDKFEIYNVYGMSESLAGISYFKLDRAYEFTPVGKPYKNVKITIEDGEICAKSYYARSYLNLGEQSARRFKECDDGEVQIRTGDSGRFDEEGNLIITGRMDFMCKINGQRVEPEEPESRLLSIPEIKEACVMGVRISDNMTALVAFYTSDTVLDIDYIKGKLKKTLPDYMIPSIYRRLVNMPRNLNGKVDRSQLTGAWEFQRHVPVDVVPLEKDDEKALASIYANILNLDIKEIGLRSNFFTLGGDSLRAVILSIEIMEKTGVRLAPADIFKHPTIEEQIELIRANKSVKDIYICNDNPDLPDIFFVHTGHAGGEAYYNLSLLLKDICNVKCLEPHNVFHPDDIITGIENLAEKYISNIKAVKPEGPYFLGGWSYGGLIAYEMARQLSLSGDEVKYLFIMDSNFMSSDRERELYIDMFNRDSFDSYLEKDPLFERFRQMGVIDSVVSNSKNVVYDMTSYVPKPYDGRATFFKAYVFENEDMLGEELSGIIKGKKANGFDKLIKKLKIINIGSDHDRIMTGYALYKIALHIEYTLDHLEKGYEDD